MQALFTQLEHAETTYSRNTSNRKQLAVKKNIKWEIIGNMDSLESFSHTTQHSVNLQKKAI